MTATVLDRLAPKGQTCSLLWSVPAHQPSFDAVRGCSDLRWERPATERQAEAVTPADAPVGAVAPGSAAGVERRTRRERTSGSKCSSGSLR